MDQARQVTRDVHPGISAVLAADAPTELERDVLDLAAVLDGLVNDKFEIIVGHVTCADRVTDRLAELRVLHRLPLRLLEGDRPPGAGLGGRH
jgi:hypothetical protein